ncbi:MAG: dicarboxylate/amino acid:cation symporter [Oscillospiraceae bacterium]|jgi:proton glutamate symport protein|nr:dicarboxylate/amino acid:cation symporter [Oscillospiraceae bacterium]
MIKKIFTSPITLFLAMILGALTGILGKEHISSLSLINDVFINFLNMCMIPIVACVITINLSKVSRNKKKQGSKGVIKSWVLYTAASFVLAALISLFFSFFLKNFLTPDTAAKQNFVSANSNTTVSSLFEKIPFYDDDFNLSIERFSFYDFLISAIPNNVFSALSSGETLKIIFFFATLGVMQFYIKEESSKLFTDLLDNVYSSLNKFVSYILIFSPVSIFCILAAQFSDDNKINILKSTFNLIVVIYVIFFSLILASFFIIQIKTKLKIKEHLRAIKQIFVISMSTRSCLATIPTAVENSKKYLKLEPSVVDMTLPLGITIAQSGGVVSAVMATTYTLYIHNESLKLDSLVGLILGACMYAVSFVGIPGVIAVGMLSSVLTPLGLPSDVIIMIWIGLITVIDPILTFQCVYTNIAITSLVTRKKTTPTINSSQ